jgi:hypothetical protein
VRIDFWVKDLHRLRKIKAARSWGYGVLEARVLGCCRPPGCALRAKHAGRGPLPLPCSRLDAGWLADGAQMQVGSQMLARFLLKLL